MSMPIIPEHYKELQGKNRFPIALQLGVLFVIMCSMFSTLWLLNAAQKPPAPTDPYPTIPLNAANVSGSLTELSDVSIRATSAYVWDVKGQRALYKKNETDVVPLASITKLMTALLVHELVPETETIPVPVAAIRQEGNSGLLAGENLTVEELAEFALISSSNDAAYSLAASVGSALGERTPTNQFVAAMNIRAEELGLNTLQFKNMTGLDESETVPGAVGNARDVSFLLEHIVTEYPELLEPTKQAHARIYNDEGAFHDIRNTNPVLSDIPNLIGSKTGYTDLAGGNLTVAFDLGLDRPIIITVLGSTRDQRFSDVLTLVEAIQNSVNPEPYD